MKRTSRFTSGLFVLVVALSACGPKSAQSTSDIVVTNSVLASIVQAIVGDSARVESVIPDGKDPHEFQPSAGDIAKIANAKVIVANGFGYEPTLVDAIASARADHVTVFDVEREIPGLAGNDPHWFTDPLMAAAVAAKLVPVLELSFGVSLEESFATALSDFQAAVDEGKKTIDAVAPATSAGSPCAFGSEHVFLGPFSARFGCPSSAVLHTGSLVPDAEPSAAMIEDFVAAVRGHGLRVLLADASEQSKVLAQVARQTGAQVVAVNVHAMGSATDYRTYVTNIVNSLVAGLA
jgi:hypothetical protein